MPRRLDLQLPPPPRRSRLAIVASLFLHAVMLGIIAVSGWVPPLIMPRSEPVVLAPLPPTGVREPVAPRAPARHRPGARRVSGVQPLPGASRTIEHPTAPVPAPAAAPVVTRPQPTAVDTGSAAAQRIAPGLARGKLWVTPLPLPPKELAERLKRSHVELVDSAVTATIQAFLDSIAADPASRAATLPSWTTTIAGKKFGLDSRNIYVAGLKIPAAVLGLLHLPGGNDSKAFDRSGWLYEDLRIAAQRSANVADFKREIREIRERKEREREFDRNRRTAPSEEEAQ